MGRAYRLAGAIVAVTGDDQYLVGNTKEPCDFRSRGFEPPAEIDAKTRPYLRLVRSAARNRPASDGEIVLGGAFLELAGEGEGLARMLAERFVIERTGSVSERLWRLVCTGGDPDAMPPDDGALDARWLSAVPAGVWTLVRDSVLRCL